MTRKQAGMMRHLRPTTVALCRAMEEISDVGAQLCDHGLDPEAGNEDQDNCPCCVLWGLILEARARTAEFAKEFDKQLEHGPPPLAGKKV